MMNETNETNVTNVTNETNETNETNVVPTNLKEALPLPFVSHVSASFFLYAFYINTT